MPEFRCEHCGKEFEQESSMRQHVNDKHAPKPEEKPTQQDHAHAAHLHGHSEAKQEHHHHDQHLHSAHQGAQKVKIKISKGVIYAIVAVLAVGAGGYGAYAYLGSLPQSTGGDSTASSLSAPIGALGSTHSHADFAVFMDGEEVTPLDPRYFVRNAFVHVESGPGAGTVIHLHATNVPLGFFFRSLGMGFSNECFRLDNGREYCNDGGKTLKMFVQHWGGQWEENRQFHTYVPQDLDRVLVTYGDETPEEIQLQQDAVTQLSEANSDRQMSLGDLPR